MQWSFGSIAQAVGGGFVLIFVIYEIFTKLSVAFGWFKKSRDAKTEKQQEANRKFLQKVFDETVQPELTKIDAKLASITKDIKELGKTDIDILRSEITDIYTRYLPYEAIPVIEFESCSRLVERYFDRGGNAYVETIWHEIQQWRKVASEKDLKGL